MPLTRRFALWATLAALCLGGAHAGWAALEIRSQVGFDGLYLPGEWTPIEVLLSNVPAAGDRHAPRDLEGVVRVRTRGFDGRPFLYSREVDLPANSRKRVWLVIKAAAENLGAPPEIEVEFRATNRRARVGEITMGRVIPPGTALVLIVREPGRPESLRLPGVSESQSFAVATVTALPDQWAALSSVAAIFLPRTAALRLGIGEVEALRRWVEQGGVLAVDGGGGGGLMSAPIADLLPVEVGERTTWRITGAGLFEPVAEGTDPLPPGSVVLLAATAREGADVVWSQGEGQVLAASRAMGLGRVAFVAWDLADATMSQNIRAETTLARFLPPASAQLSHDQLHQQIIANIIPDPSAALPSVLFVFFLLLGYWAVVGPGNYIFLRRRQRIEWSWFTIPLVIAVFCVLFYLIGYLARGNRDTLRHINIAHVRSGSSIARADAISLHFSANKQRVDFTPSHPGSALSQITFWGRPDRRFFLPTFGQVARARPRPGFGMGRSPVAAMRDVSDPASVTQDREGMWLDDQRLRQWNFAYLESMGPVDLGGAIDVTCRFAPDAADSLRLVGEVTNTTPMTLAHCAILWGDRCFPLVPGDLAPGQRVVFDAPWGAFQSRDLYDSAINEGDSTQIRLASLRATMLDDVEIPWLNPRTGQPRLVAFTEQALLAPEPDREVERETDCTLVMVDLPLEVGTATPFEFDSAHLPLTYSVRAAADDSVRFEMESYDEPHLRMRSAALMVTQRLPWSDLGRVEVTALSALLAAQDSDSQEIHLWALDRTATSGDPWIEVPIRQGAGMVGGGMVAQGPHPLDPTRVVDRATGEVTLLVEAGPRSGTTMSQHGQYALVRGIDLKIRGRVWPATP